MLEGIQGFISNGMLVLAGFFILVVLLVLVARVSSYYKTVPPNEVMIVFGQRHKEMVAGRGAGAAPETVDKGYVIVKGGGRMVWPVINSAASLDLSLMTILPSVKGVYTVQGVQVSVDGVAQIKIGGDDVSISTAAERLLGKTLEDIKQLALQSLEGHLRAIVGTMTVEELYKDRNAFSQNAAKLAANDMGGMGLEIVSFTISDIKDNQGYLEALGVPQVQAVKRDAAIAEANASKEIRTKRAEADQVATLAEQDAELKKAQAKNTTNIKKAELQVNEDTAQAKADMASQLQTAMLQKQLAENSGAAEIERQKQQALAAEQSIEVAEKKAKAEIVIPASAQKEAMVITAQGEKEKAITIAQASAQATELQAGANAKQISLTREAEATGITAVGKAEATKTQAVLEAQATGERQLAEARAAQGQVNVTLEIARAMIAAQVEIAKHYAQALGGMGSNMRIVQFAGGTDGQKTGNPLFDMLLQTPEIASKLQAMSEALSGKDVPTVLAEVMSVLRGMTVPVQEVTPEVGSSRPTESSNGAQG